MLVPAPTVGPPRKRPRAASSNTQPSDRTRLATPATDPRGKFYPIGLPLEAEGAYAAAARGDVGCALSAADELGLASSGAQAFAPKPGALDAQLAWSEAMGAGLQLGGGRGGGQAAARAVQAIVGASS